jgi:hypothetical protein
VGPLKNALNHGFSSDFGERLAGETGGFEACGNDCDDA